MVLESNTLDVLFVKDGQQGEDGKVLYTWIKYAKDANGTGMTDDPNGAIYIGISYNNESSIESNDPTQYAWTKIQGADGKKGEDAYTIFLENENISFATDENRNPLSEQAYTSGITIMKGAKPVTDFAIGDIAKTQGIAVAKTNTAIAISVVNGNPLPNDSGEIEIPITVGGTVFKKILTWTCAKKGDQGEQGERGLQGIQGPQGIQGVAGKDGTNGKTTYFHIKYSSVANPTSSSQLTETPSTYIGTYVDFTETDSTDPKKYTWSQFVGSQGPKGEQGIAGVGVDGKTSYLHIAYANSADGKTGFSTSDSTNKSYIGQYTDFTPNDSTDYTKYSWSLIRGKDGTDGVSPTVSVTKNGKTTTITITDKNGTHTQTVKDGTDGTPGQTGKDGKTTYFHVKYSNDGGQTFTSNSGEDVGAYIGTCTDYNQADPTTVGVYTWARIKGEKGDQGVRGEKGKDGTSVTITNKSITYQLSTSGTTIPTGTWQTSPQTIPEGQYQWTKTSVTYSDGNKTESYSISYHGKNGSDGTSVKTTSTSVKYQVGDSGTTKPTGTWQSNVPTVAQGKYLWTQTVVNYSDGNSTESYSVSYRGIDGSNGSNGMNAATVYLYQRATSTPSKPSNTLTYTFSTTKITGTLSNGWSTAIPTGTDAVYVTVASVSSKNDTTTIAASAWSAPVVLAQNGKTGSDGKAGLNVATIYLYQRNISKPSKPSASVTYTFSTGVASGLNNGWSQKIPDGTNPLYVTLATASSNTATDTILSSEWSDVVVMAQNGEDGQDGAGFHWNLLKYSGDLSKQVLGGAGTYTATVESIEDKTTPSGQAEKITYTVQGTGGKFIQTGKYIKEGDIKQGKTYTVSVWCKCSSIKSTGVINAEFLDNKTYVNPTLSTEWQQYVVTGVANKDVTSTSSASAISFYYNDNMSVGDIFYISSPKVEEGDKPSPWCTTYEETLAKNLSITPSSQYFKSTDGGKTFAPNTITIKPTIQGEINFGKWQYSIDGGVSFADVVSGQKGLTINNNVLSISKDSSLYSDAVTMVTFRAVANDSSFYDTCSIAKIYDVSDIGDGRNLLWNSNFAKTDEAITGTTNSWGLHTRGTNLVASIDTSTKHNGFNTLKTVSAVNGDKNSSNDLEWFAWGISERTSDNLHSKNQNYTLSFYAKASVTTDFIVRWGYDAYGADTTRTLTTNWQKYEIKLHQATSAYSITIIFKLLTAGTVWFSEFKLEKGSSATGYSTAPEDLQTAILSTKSEISDVSLKVDKNKQAIEQRVEKTTYEQDLTLVKGDISKANEGLNKWKYEIYPKNLFASEYQGKSTMDVFAKNTNLTPSQSVLINDTDLSIAWNYDNNYIGYALTFTKFSAAKSVAITFAHDDGAHIYLNGKLIGGSDAYSQTGESLTLGFVKGWNCIEIVVNEGASTEGFKLGTTISSISECQLMNCYYGTPVARQSHITNQLVENTTNIKGVTTTMQKVMTTVGGSDRIDEFVNNYNKTIESEKQFKKTIGETYTTKDEFNGLEIGGRNLVLDSKPQKQGSSYAVVSRHLSVDLQAGVTYTISFCGRVVDGDGSLVVYLYRNDWKDSIQKSTKSKENTVISWQFTPKINGAFQIEAYSFLSQGVAGGNVYLDWFKVEKGNKATDWTPAPEDNGINGQNLVSNLPANWEQGTFQDSKTNVGCDYNTNKASMTTRIRVKELVPVSGTITISNAYSNQSKKPIQNMITAFDVNKKWLGNSYVSTDWNDFPRIVDMKDAKYIAVVVRYKDESAITPSDISQICLKIERGTSATPFTLAPEDVNGKIVNVETIANQTAKKFEWIVKGESTSSNLVLTDNALTAIANNINLTGKVTFSWLNNETQKKITDANTWVTNNGSSTTSLNSMVKKWTDGAVSDTTQINGGWIKANTITASKIAVGDFTNYADINESNTYGFTVEKTADGVWFSKDGSKLGRDNYISKMYSCEPGQTFYVEYDISNTIKDSTEYKAAGTMLFGCDGTQTVKWYQRRGAVVGTAAGTVTHMSQQLTMPSSTRFFYVVLQIEGHPPFTGTLKIRNLSVRKAVTGAVIVDGSITADKIATDAIKSRNYISSGGTQGSFLNLSDGSFTSPNLSWDSNGNLIASNANLSGLINATKGTVGGWNIATNGLYSGIDENAIKIYSATTYDAQTMYQKQKIQDSFILSQKYINHFVSQQVSVGHNIPYWQTRSFIYNDSQIQLAQSDYCINTSSASNYDAQYSLKDGYISATRIYMEQNITQVGGDVINSSFSIGLDSMMGWCSIQSTKGINIYGNSSRALYVQSNDTSKYNALETEGDVVVNGKIHAVSGDNKIQLNSDNNGSIELYGNTPFIDFHSAYSSADYTCRIIANTPEQLLVCGKLRCDSNIISNNDLIANSWVYAGQNAHYTWQNQLDCYFSCGYYNNTNNVYYYAGYHAFYVNNDSGSGMMYINTNGVTSRVGFTKTSDERIKKNFESFDDNIIDAYMNIEPVKYQLKQSSNDNYHFGFKAQHVDKVFSDYGDTYNESFDICTSRPIDPDKAKELYGVDDMTEEYGLRYDELIAPTTYMVQHIYKELESTKGELAKVKQEKADLETRLQAIEAKLRL